MRNDHSGPVHPTPWTNDGDMHAYAPNGQAVPPGGTVMLEGMTVRDEFASRALIGLLTSGNPATNLTLDAVLHEDAEHNRYIQQTVAQQLSMASYALADAMLAERAASLQRKASHAQSIEAEEE